MAIPTTGEVTFQQIAAETGYGGTDGVGLINSCTNAESPVQVDKNAPYSSEDFRGYDHSYKANVDSGLITVSAEGGTVNGQEGDYRYTATLYAASQNDTGTIYVAYRVAGGSWAQLHNESVTVIADTDYQKTGTVYLYADTSYEFKVEFDGVLLDDTTKTIGSGGPPV